MAPSVSRTTFIWLHRTGLPHRSRVLWLQPGVYAHEEATLAQATSIALARRTIRQTRQYDHEEVGRFSRLGRVCVTVAVAVLALPIGALLLLALAVALPGLLLVIMAAIFSAGLLALWPLESAQVQGSGIARVMPFRRRGACAGYARRTPDPVGLRARSPRIPSRPLRQPRCSNPAALP